jgi:serine/threonine protein kinase/Tol biopolymer transport system component
MALASGTRLGPYEIVAPLGAGGMGEVYRARDTRLGREVAVKVLPERFAGGDSVRARFEREAKSISALNHPNICTLHDVGHDGDRLYLVMEMIDGESLGARLQKGPLPLDQVLRIGVEIALGIDAAHRQGIVHRDLKPDNVMLTRSGAKLLDFGLAKSGTERGAPIDGFTSLPTEQKALTQEGTILGTFQYMAPEQLEGQEADARTDIFALGAVLYEMATGKRAFQGKNRTSLIAAIVSAQPAPLASIIPATPPALDQVIRKCLEKDPEDRWQSARDVAGQLRWIAEAGSQAGLPAPITSSRKTRERLAWGVAVFAALTTMAIAAAAFLRPTARPPLIVSSIVPPEGATFDSGSMAMTLSPDGRQIAFVARSASGSGLWVRSLDAAKPRLLAGTEDAECPFWSPDARSLGFYSHGQLRKIDIAGGQSEALAPMSVCLGASWGSDGSILYVSDRYVPIMRIPESGGQPVAVTTAGPAESKRTYSQPSLLPDRRHVLYTINESWEGGDHSGIFVASIDGKDERKLLPLHSNAVYAEPGYLIYGREGSLRAQRFNLDRLELSGTPSVLIDGVQYLGLAQSHLFSLSDSGLMAYIAGAGNLTRQLTWIDRKGSVLEMVGKPGNYFSPRLSHDGKRIAYDLSDATSDSGDIWALDRERGNATRLTFDPRNESSPIWSPDDRLLLFFANFPGHSDLLTVLWDGTGSIETMVSNGMDNYPCDWSIDGKTILVQTTHGSGLGNTDLMLYSVADKKSSPWLVTPFVEKQGRFSPDRKWIAYASDESGRTEVYVRGFDPPGGKWRVSSEGGDSPVWRRDGKELYFLTSDSTVMSVAVGQGATFNAAAPVPLFRIPGEILALGVVTQYDVSPDGQRFLMNLNTPTQGQRAITLVSSWPALLPAR